MIILDATNETIELLTGAAVSTDWSISYADISATGLAAGGGEGNVSTATTTTIIAAPGSSTQRQVKAITVRNRGTTTQTVTLKKDIASTEYYITPTVSLAGGEMLWIGPEGKPEVIDAAGRAKAVSLSTSAYTGRAVNFHKVGTAAEAIGTGYCFSKDSGIPGAWAVGTSGVAGRATDGTAAGDVGCIPFQNPATGSMYLTGFTASQTIAGALELWDVLWVNNGIAVTTTTAQAIGSVAFPARDINGAVTGVGVNVAILATAATTNAGAITNTTMAYTDAGGLGALTATMASWPATAVIGTVVPFQLAAGSTGVTAITSVTLGTSYAGGSISLIAYRKVAVSPGNIVNVGLNGMFDSNPGIRLYNGSCLLLVRPAPAATTATTIGGIVVMAER